VQYIFSVNVIFTYIIESQRVTRGHRRVRIVVDGSAEQQLKEGSDKIMRSESVIAMKSNGKERECWKLRIREGVKREGSMG